MLHACKYAAERDPKWKNNPGVDRCLAHNDPCYSLWCGPKKSDL